MTFNTVNQNLIGTYKYPILLTLLLISNFCFAQTFAEKYTWIIGKWELKTTKSTLIEEWKLRDDSTFIGISYSLGSENARKVLETIELRSRNGKSSYVPIVMNQNNSQEVIFEIKAEEQNKFIAENLSHDYPQRICYELKTKEQLYAKIEGIKNGKENKAEWVFKKLPE